jgi:hypothetical protein
MEAKYAPPDHPVFQLTPEPFDRRANIYYEAMGRPQVNSSTFWTVYQDLLQHFRSEPTGDELEELLDSLHISTEQISRDDLIEVLPLKKLRAGDRMVGVIGGSIGSFSADMTDSGGESDSEGFDRDEDGHHRVLDGQSIFATMTPTQSEGGEEQDEMATAINLLS